MATERDDEREDKAPADEAPLTDDRQGVTLTAEDLDDDDSPPEGQRETRKERRAKRYASKLDEANEERRQLREQIASMERRLQAALAQQSAPPPARQAQGEDSDPDLEPVEREQELLLRRLATPGIASDEEQQLIRRHKALDRKRMEIIASRSSRPAEVDDIAVMRAMLRAEYADIYENPHARQAAQLELAHLMAAGEPEGFHTARKAADNVRRRMGLATARPAPSDAQRAKYTNTSAAPGPSSAGGGVTLTPEEMQFARAHVRGRKTSRPLDDKEIAKIYLTEVLRPAGLR